MIKIESNNNISHHLYEFPRMLAGLKTLLYCVGILLTGFTALFSKFVRSSLSYNWKILCGENLSKTDQKVSDAFQAAKTGVDTAMRRNLSNLLKDDDLLMEVLKNKQKFLENERPHKSIYKYINGIRNEKGEACEIAIPQTQYEDYFNTLWSSKKDDIEMSIQGGQLEKNVKTEEDKQKSLFPFKSFIKNKENKNNFSALPQEHQNYINEAIAANYTNITKDEIDRLRKMEVDLLSKLTGNELTFFKQCLKEVNDDHVVRSGFIHFRACTSVEGRPIERIYIKMNKEHSSDLAKKIISELYKDNQFPGVIDIKVAGPQTAGRTDGIVIYIGDKEGGTQVDDSARAIAVQQCNAVVAKLLKIQEENPNFFSYDKMPFKKIEGKGGISTIPGLSNAESFTTDISRAIEEALKSSSSVEEFREKIIVAYATQSWMV